MFNFVERFYFKVLKSIIVITVLNIFICSIDGVAANVDVKDSEQQSLLSDKKEVNLLQVFLDSLKRDERDDLLDGQKDDTTLVNLFSRITNQLETEREKLSAIDKTFLKLCDLIRNQEVAKEELKKVLIDTVSTLNTLIEDSEFVTDSGKQLISKIEILSRFLRFLINKKDLNLGSLENEFQDILDRLSSFTAQIINTEAENIIPNQIDSLVLQGDEVVEEKLNDNELGDEVVFAEKDVEVFTNEEQTKIPKRSFKKDFPKVAKSLKKAGKFTGRVIGASRGITPGGIGLNIIGNLLYHRDEIVGRSAKLSS